MALIGEVAASGVAAAGASHAGRVREQNEDCHLIDDEGRIFAVADGMGGHAAGEVASAIAVRSVHRAWAAIEDRDQQATGPDGDPDRRRALFRAVREGVVNAHLEILAQGKRDERQHGMGTTFTGFLVAGGEAVFAHAGDSRAYLVRGGAALQLSEDHTILARLRAVGVEPPDGDEDEDFDAAREESAAARWRRISNQRWRGVLTNALGIGDTRVAIFAVTMESGDHLVLCTDGVHEYLSGGDTELASLVAGAASPAVAASRLVDLALDRGGGDNATAVVVKVLEVGPEPRGDSAGDGRAVEACPLFAPLSPQERLRALRITTRRTADADQELDPMGQGERVAYVVLEGAVALPSGERLGPGGLVYAEALIEGTGPLRQLATAAGPTRLLVIRRSDFLELTEEEPDLGVKLYAVLARLMAR